MRRTDYYALPFGFEMILRTLARSKVVMPVL